MESSALKCTGSDGCLLGKKMALDLKKQEEFSACGSPVDNFQLGCVLWSPAAWVGWPVLLAGQPSVCLLDFKPEWLAQNY